MDKYRPYKVTGHQEVEIGRFKIIKDIIKINGTEYPYSYEKAEPCVCILPVSGNDVILIRQYRHSFNEWFYEIPAGGIDGEQAVVAANRELTEETGYVAEKMIYLGEYPISRGTSCAVAYLYVAICGKKIQQKLDATELIEVCQVSKDKFEEMIKNREYRDWAGITAWYLYQNNVKG